MNFKNKALKLEGLFSVSVVNLKFFPTSGTHKPGPQTIPLSKKKNSRNNMVIAKSSVEIPGSPSPSLRHCRKVNKPVLWEEDVFLTP